MMKQFAPILEGDRGRAADHQWNKSWAKLRQGAIGKRSASRNGLRSKSRRR